MFYVKKMSADDFAFAVHLTDTMRWNLTENDFKFMKSLEPDGCFVLLDGSKKIGLATVISFDKVGWLGNVIVCEGYRGRGAGSLLVRHALKYLKNNSIETVGLYAYLDKVPFYRRLGFNHDSAFTVLRGTCTSSVGLTNSREALVRDLEEIIRLDGLCFGASRRKLLEPILQNSRNFCYVFKKNRRVRGFVAAKVYQETAEIGPLVCCEGLSEVALDLLKAALNRLDGFEALICVSEKEPIVINTLIRLGFKEEFRVVRLFYGIPIHSDCIYAAESLERG